MSNDNKVFYNVKNRSAGRCVYKIPELHVRREFQPGQTFKVSAEELELLRFQPGGLVLMMNYLQIQSEEALERLDVEVEPEYNMSEQDIINLIKNGSLDEFKDALDFAPIGVIDLIKAMAVSLPMNDSEKRDAIKAKFGFDVDAAIRHEKEDKEEAEENKQVVEKKTRRVKKDTTASTSTSKRRTTAKKYEVKEDEPTEE